MRVIPLSVVEKVCLPNTLVLLLQCRDLPTLATWACFVCLIVNPYPIYGFIFFRLAYNVGLGVLLRHQSQTEFVTRFVEALKKDGGSWQYRLVRKSLRDVRTKR